jgi:hypothetical protein
MEIIHKKEEIYRLDDGSVIKDRYDNYFITTDTEYIINLDNGESFNVDSQLFINDSRFEVVKNVHIVVGE